MKRLFFIPDCHIPYHDKQAWKVALNAIEAFNPHTLILLGDFGDFYATSRHPKNPNRSQDLKVEVDACNAALDELDVAMMATGNKAAEKHYILGNHEHRLERYLQEKAPELFNLVSVKDLFLLNARGWTYTPYGEHLMVGKLLVTHDVGYAGANAHIQSANATGTNTLIGHTHRLAATYGGTSLGRHTVACMGGWLGDRKQADYGYAAKKAKDWQLGFVLGHAEPNGTVHLTPTPIIDYKCIVSGNVVKA